MARESEESRFSRKFFKQGDDECWEWQATRTKEPNGGYGVFYALDPKHGKKRNMPAHRWSYLHHRGPIPDGKIVMHICDNRRCVNPNHLKLGTLQDNAQDMMNKNRWGGVCGEQHFRTTLTTQEIAEIRKRYAQGNVYQYELAAEYGVSQSTIGRIVRGQVWSHAPGKTGSGQPHRGPRHHNAKLTSEQVIEIRRRYKNGGCTQKQLAETFGISAKHVSEIIRGNKRRDE